MSDPQPAIRVNGVNSLANWVVVIPACPTCGNAGTLEPVTNPAYDQQVSPDGHRVGLRRCPNPLCHELIFCIQRADGVFMTYPATRLAFDASHIPPRIAKSLEEAITCHANCCFVAAAIMVRKTLEEFCHEQQAKGENLLARLRALRARVVLPEALFEGLDRLRLLGNDAAHFEAKTFNQVGADEVEVAIDFTKEVLKASYQYNALLARMKALEKPE